MPVIVLFTCNTVPGVKTRFSQGNLKSEAQLSKFGSDQPLNLNLKLQLKIPILVQYIT